MSLSNQARRRAKALTLRVTVHGISRQEAAKRPYKTIRSIGTETKVRGNIKRFLLWLLPQGLTEHDITEQIILQFLSETGQAVTQKTLDGYRTAIETVFKLRLPYCIAAKPTVLVPRAYSDQQIELLCRSANEKLSLSIRIAAAAGLRASELHTLTPRSPFREDIRPWSPQRFAGRDAEKPYGVIGKGGLRRQIRLPGHLSNALEQRRLSGVKRIHEREINYYKHFDLLGGQAFSDSFSALSQRVFGWSEGAHGLRHRFAKSRLLALQLLGFTYRDALAILSQELGHFSTTNTLGYLR